MEINEIEWDEMVWGYVTLFGFLNIGWSGMGHGVITIYILFNIL